MNEHKKNTPTCSNPHPCSCPSTDCPNHRRCCDCVRQHKAIGSLPMCLRGVGR